MLGDKVASELIDSSRKYLDDANTMRNELSKGRYELGKKERLQSIYHFYEEKSYTLQVGSLELIK